MLESCRDRLNVSWPPQGPMDGEGEEYLLQASSLDSNVFGEPYS